MAEGAAVGLIVEALVAVAVAVEIGVRGCFFNFITSAVVQHPNAASKSGLSSMPSAFTSKLAN